MEVALPHKPSLYTAFTASTSKIRRQEGYYVDLHNMAVSVHWVYS